MADDAMFEALCQELDQEHFEQRQQAKADKIIEDYKMGICMWTKHTKEKILVQDMDDFYVKNVLAFLKRDNNNHVIFDAWIKVFNAEIIKRKL